MSVTFTAAVGAQVIVTQLRPSVFVICVSRQIGVPVLYFAHNFRHPTNCSYTYGVVWVSTALTELVVGIISIGLTNISK